MKRYTMSTKELLELYPEFKPLWAVANTLTLRYHVRLTLLKHHEEMSE